MMIAEGMHNVKPKLPDNTVMTSSRHSYDLPELEELMRHRGEGGDTAARTRLCACDEPIFMP
jgi:hypothetical protein